MYRRTYHDAINHLIAYGAHGGSTQTGRDLCAQALQGLRQQYGRARARRERSHMRQIAGQFPVKPS